MKLLIKAVQLISGIIVGTLAAIVYVMITTHSTFDYAFYRLLNMFIR